MLRAVSLARAVLGPPVMSTVPENAAARISLGCLGITTMWPDVCRTGPHALSGSIGPVIGAWRCPCGRRSKTTTLS